MSTKLSIACWNVNSVRMRAENIINWLEESKCDVLLLQETKCQDRDFPIALFESKNYNISIAGQKAYNGVAIFSKYPVNLEMKELPMYDIEGEDLHARYIEATIEMNGKVVRVASVYVPNGASMLQKNEKLEDSLKFNYKLNFFKRLKKRMEEINKFDDEIILIGGDYNVAFEEIDLFNPEKAAGDVGFHPDERDSMTSLFNLGYKDSFRHFHPDDVEYSWWDYRRNRWGDNLGWRIDYMLANKHAIDRMQDCVIHRETRGKEKPSDHVPVEVVINL
ncbi:exodeoxyribonuclease III [Rickettsiales bacterium]|nr:exodeoxyribonuclease III [Rickettsiales bacterium]